MIDIERESNIPQNLSPYTSAGELGSIEDTSFTVSVFRFPQHGELGQPHVPSTWGNDDHYLSAIYAPVSPNYKTEPLSWRNHKWVCGKFRVI